MRFQKTTIFGDLKSSMTHKDTQRTETTQGRQLPCPRGRTHNSVVKDPRTAWAAKLKGLFSIDSQQHICRLQLLCLSRQDGSGCYHEMRSLCLFTHEHCLFFFRCRTERQPWSLGTREHVHIEEDQRLLGRKAKGKTCNTRNLWAVCK